MRLLQAMAGADYGGAEEFFVRLAIALNKSNIQQRTIIRRNKSRAERLRDGGVKTVELGFGGRLDVTTRWKLKRQIDDFNPDIVLTWMNRATLMLPSSREFVSIGRLGGYYNLKYYRRCDHLLANTNDILNHLKKNGWDNEKVHYLPNFVAGKKVPAIERKVYFTPDHAPLILALGRLHENKAFDVLFDAMTQLPNAYLWLAGDGSLRNLLEIQAENLGIKPRVRFLGWRQNVEALFAAADVFVCPSRHEPLGNVVIEAWAQGIPVVAADSLGPGTLIKQGETGILVPINDAKALAMALKQMISDEGLRTRLASQGKEVYDTRFTEKIVVDKYLKFFQSMTS